MFANIIVSAVGGAAAAAGGWMFGELTHLRHHTKKLQDRITKLEAEK